MTSLPSVNLLDPAFKANPFPIYARLRAEDPVHLTSFDGRPAWLVTRYDDVVSVLKDPRFVKDWTKVIPPEMLPNLPEAFTYLTRHMLNRDPPDHTRLRMLVHKAFTPQLIEGLRQRIQTITDELIDAMAGRGEADLIEAFAFPLPIIVISEMLGTPPEERDQIHYWSNAFITNPEQDPEAVRLMKLMPLAEEFAAYLRNKMAERRAHPREDLLSALVHVEAEGTRLDEKELISMGFLLLIAGHETTVNLIASGMLALLDHPAEQERLRNDPSLMRSAVEELLRYVAPVETATGRFAGEELEFGGRLLKKGDMVLASLAAADRDPAYFHDPDRLDLGREDNKHVAFGLGIHYCLGAPLARLEGQIAFSRLLARLPRMRLAMAREAIEWRPTLLVRGPKSLPVAF